MVMVMMLEHKNKLTFCVFYEQYGAFLISNIEHVFSNKKTMHKSK
jgi:hypothetical protein